MRSHIGCYPAGVVELRLSPVQKIIEHNQCQSCGIRHLPPPEQTTHLHHRCLIGVSCTSAMIFCQSTFRESCHNDHWNVSCHNLANSPFRTSHTDLRGRADRFSPRAFKRRKKPTEFELQDALDCVLPVSNARQHKQFLGHACQSGGARVGCDPANSKCPSKVRLNFGTVASGKDKKINIHPTCRCEHTCLYKSWEGAWSASSATDIKTVRNLVVTRQPERLTPSPARWCWHGTGNLAWCLRAAVSSARAPYVDFMSVVLVANCLVLLLSTKIRHQCLCRSELAHCRELGCGRMDDCHPAFLAAASSTFRRSSPARAKVSMMSTCSSSETIEVCMFLLADGGSRLRIGLGCRAILARSSIFIRKALVLKH